MKRQRTQKFRKAAIRNLAKFSGIAISATSPSRAGITMAAHRRPDLFGDFAHSTICRASECRECRLSTVLAAENRRAHNERGGFRFGACSATTCNSPLLHPHAHVQTLAHATAAQNANGSIRPSRPLQSPSYGSRQGGIAG